MNLYLACGIFALRLNEIGELLRELSTNEKNFNN